MLHLNKTKIFILSGAAAIGLAFAAPAALANDFIDISLEDLDFGDEDFLQQLIDMDADDIANMRAEMAEARAEIREAIGEVEAARAEAAANPETKPVVIAALEAASAAVVTATKTVFEEIRTELDDAETDLAAADISAEEMSETKAAIAALREELAGIEDALGELVAAMRA